MSKFYFIDRKENGLLFLTSHTKEEAFSEIPSLSSILDTEGTLVEFTVTDIERFAFIVFSMDCTVSNAIEYWYTEKEDVDFGYFRIEGEEEEI